MLLMKYDNNKREEVVNKTTSLYPVSWASLFQEAVSRLFLEASPFLPHFQGKSLKPCQQEFCPLLGSLRE